MRTPNKLDKQFIKQICEYLSKGYTVADTCRMSGISVGTFKRWRKAAKVDRIGIFNDLYNSLKEVEAEINDRQEKTKQEVIERHQAALEKQLQRQFKPIRLV